MSLEETRGLVRRFVDALNLHDLPAAMRLVSPDVAYDPPVGARVIGSAAMRDALAAQPRETIGDLALMTDESGGRAAAEFTRRGEAGGRSYSRNAGFFLDIDNGRITRLSDMRAAADV